MRREVDVYGFRPQCSSITLRFISPGMRPMKRTGKILLTCEHDAASFLFFFALLIASLKIVLKIDMEMACIQKNDCVIINRQKKEKVAFNYGIY